MKINKAGDGRVAKIIYKQNPDPEAEYKLSRFVYPYHSQGRYLLRHNLSLEVRELSEAEWKAVTAIKEQPKSYSFLKENGIVELAEAAYLIPLREDELKQYEKVVFLLKTMSGAGKGLDSYVIFPTTGCNARCVYCYEEGIAVKNMTPQTADRLADFIDKTRRIKEGEPINLRWFGGEPLAGASIISRICRALSERGILYQSDMITNATLLTPEMAKEAKELWRLKKVQVSLDGAREDYERRKNYFMPQKHNYDAAMRAVHLFLEQGIRTQLRVNVDFENIGRIPGFFRELKEEFGAMENMSVYLSPLYQENEKDSCLDLYKEIYRLTDLQTQLGIPRTARSGHDLKRFRTNMCMADAMGRSIVITPEGVFNNCEHLPEERSWGNIFEGVTDPEKEKALSARPAPDKTCAGCAFLPECTPFYKKGCPAWFSKCYEYHCLKTEYMLDKLLKGADIGDDDDEEI